MLRGADKEKAFEGTDADAQAFCDFIVRFLGSHGRWNSPQIPLWRKLRHDTRGAGRVPAGEQQVPGLKRVILLSQILAFDNSADDPQDNPGIDQPYVLALPTYAATAWYHHDLPNQPAQLEPFLAEVEQFAMGDYWSALAAGGALSAERKAAIAGEAPHLHRSARGLSAALGPAGECRAVYEDSAGQRHDHRSPGFAVLRSDHRSMSREADYDPQSASIQSAYVSVFNDYVRTTLGFGQNYTYKAEIDNRNWDFLHQPPDQQQKLPQAPNVMGDLADAMKMNPNLKVQLNAGYFDLATPFFEGMYEMSHLPIQDSLRKNIEMHFYQSGHMVYAHEPSLKDLHTNVAAFIRSTH